MDVVDVSFKPAKLRITFRFRDVEERWLVRVLGFRSVAVYRETIVSEVAAVTAAGADEGKKERE